MSNEPIVTKPKKLLIITSSAGGGLLQTANAKEQEARANDPNLIIIKKDMLKDWVWRPLGNFFIHFWNNAQRKGNISALMLCVSGQFFVDFVLHVPLFLRALYEFFKEDVDHIIDTQVFGTKAMLRALRIYNKRRGKNVILEKVLVDLPTRKATHFFRPIKNLSKKDRKILKLTTIQPLLEDGESEEDFWQSTCGLSASEINQEEVYVRRAFHKYKGKDRPSEKMNINIAFKNKEELKLMKKSFNRGEISSVAGENQVTFEVSPSDRVFTVLLGSQPATDATLNYVKKLTAFAKESPKIRTYLFVYCAEHKEKEKSLLKSVADFVARIKNYPKNFSIIPFTYQKEDAIASLFFRSDMTCTRSGGQTAMELMCVSTGQIWIHSEAKKGQDVLLGIPGWEGASAVYLQKLKGAKILTPDTIIDHARGLHQTNNRRNLPNRELESTA